MQAADHGRSFDQDPAGHFLRCDGWISRAGVDRHHGTRDASRRLRRPRKGQGPPLSLYDDAWMPNMQRITGTASRCTAGRLHGYAASHGCVRMPYGFAEKLFDKTWIGMRVIIAPTTGPGRVSHTALSWPNARAVAAAPAACRDARPGPRSRQDRRQAKRAAATAARRDSIAHGVAAQAGMAQDRVDAELAFADKAARRRQDGRGQGAGRGPEAEGRRPGRGTGDAARHRQG